MTLTSFPVLYKLTSTGALQSWNIRVLDREIITEYGQVGGAIQTARDTVKEGKSAGRSNETTPEEQAVLEAKSQWDRKKKKNYVEDIERAKKAETDVVGGIPAMLAHTYSKQGHKIKFPAYVQCKYDGIRMLAVVLDGSCTLWTRARKQITALPHIEKSLEDLFPEGEHKFDGEAYNHSLKHDFEKIVSCVRSDEPKEDHTLVQYHIYDIVTGDKFSKRTKDLSSIIPADHEFLRLAKTTLVDSEASAVEEFTSSIEEGYEGLMLRNADGLYVGKRSYDLQKLKEFDSTEYEIVGMEEGRGKLTGHVGSFVLKTSDGTEFKAKMAGDLSYLKVCFEDHRIWLGKHMEVKYQGITNKNSVPRFPIAIRIREKGFDY